MPKTRMRQRPQGRHGTIRRIVDSGIPMKPLTLVAFESLREAADEANLVPEEFPDEFFLPNVPPEDR